MDDGPRFAMGRRRFLQAAAGAAALATLPATRAAAGAAGAGPSTCDPFSAQPVFRGVVPAPEDVLGFPLGAGREVSSAEADSYLRAVAGASDRVVAGLVGTSVEGRPIRYAIVGRADRVTPEGLAGVQADVATIRDPGTPSGIVAALAADTPLILWVIANVHGSEESGADASLRILYELADRDDCVVERILERAIVVFVPVQNPDGREGDKRRNAYGFDLNRDLFARTQRETDDRVELMRRFPPNLLVDDHEFGYYRSFFPPNNDPVFHEVPRQALHQINDVYGAAISARFVDEGEDFFHGGIYDFFSPEYNDTVSTVGFGAAGMTIEVYNGAPLDRRFHRHATVTWVSLWQAANRREAIWKQLHRSVVDAAAQGRAGTLQPNIRNFHLDRRIHRAVPRRSVRHYFVRDDDPAKAWEVRRLIRRLQRMDVLVYRLEAPLEVPDLRPHTRAARRTMLPAGTFWIPMAQAQKHWIQMLMNEDTYQPAIYTYGLTGWSNPLAMNVAAAWSGARLDPAASLASPQPEPPPPPLPADLPTVGLYQMSFGSYAEESCGSTRWTFDALWGLPFTEVTNEGILAGALDGIDVLVAPGGDFPTAMRRLGEAGGRALVDWVNAGGRYVGYRGGGAKLAVVLGISTAVMRDPRAWVPGALVRAAVDPASPLADGVGPLVWILDDDDDTIVDPGMGSAPIVFPTAASGDAFVSGMSIDEVYLEGTAACVDEPVGEGRCVLFPSDPTFQGQIDGYAKVLRNAILGPDPVGRGSAMSAGSPGRAAAEHRARNAVTGRPDWPGAFRLIVPASDGSVAIGILRRYGFRWHANRVGDRVRLLLANPSQRSFEEHRAAIAALRALRGEGVDVLAFRGR